MKEIQNNFSNSAENYNRFAILQKEIAKRLFQNKIKPFLQDGQKILDLGCGTGFLGNLIKKSGFKVELDQLDFSQNMLDIAKQNGYQTILADIDKFNSLQNYDLIVSSLALQWCNLESLLQKINTKLAIATLADKTFSELKNSNISYYPLLSLKRIRSIASDFEVQDFLIKEDFSKDFFKKLKLIGANYCNKNSFITKSNYKKTLMVKKISWQIVFISNTILAL